MQHGELHYAAYALLLNNIDDTEVWMTYVRRVSTLPQVVPLTYFDSAQLARLYL